MSRISISKSTRFEIFKRDGFTCQYCGAHPPQFILEVDHIVPVANGGDNDWTNLVTACFDCNRGKAARDLAAVPQSLAERAAEIKEREEQLLGYSAIMAAHRARIEDDVWTVFEHWGGRTEVPRDQFESVKRFVGILGLHEVLDAVDVAVARPRSAYAEWKYFCGVCWKKIKDAGL